MRKLIASLLVALCALVPCLANAGQMLQAFEPDSLAHIIGTQKGNPFILVVWSLDCVYCQASLKALAQEKRKHKDLTVVTISTDAVNDPEAVALMQKRLDALGMTRHAWAFGMAPPEQLRYAIDPRWHGEKPRSYWFNARGEKTAYSGVITAEMIGRFAAR
ncbi:redoxin domain-containing protein [Herbaspirillum sp. ST 5-3]|uniref:TlpA family protein disulfide reductase n=1 Tax=Oxalobacteraceae TaxID=75682 RepID=UPI0010A414E6|nr:redoxin domain-containing protein [Herbaspirillum sp. ST 5-3]